MKRTRQRKKTVTSTTCLCCKGTTSSGKQPKNSTPAGPTMEPAADQPRDVPIPAVPDSLTYAPAATGSSTPYPSQVQSDILFPTATTNRQLPLPLDPNVGLHTVPLDPNVGLHTAMPSFDIDSSSSSDEDQGFSFSQALHTHARDILPGTGHLYAEPISTPILSQVKKSICKDILRNKFVEMAALLPSTLSRQANQYTLQLDSNSQISITPKSNLRKITTIEQWTTAMIRFMAVYTFKFPSETQALLKYTEIVRDISSRRPGSAFIFYDTQFRLLRESIPLPWNRLHTEFWLMACTSVPTQHSSPSFRPQRNPTRAPYRQSSSYKKYLENTCFNYNKRSLCHTPSCPNPTPVVIAEGPTQHTNAHSLPKSPLLKPSPLLDPLNQSDKTPIVTPVQIAILAPYLSGYHWANNLMDGFTYGFKLGYLGPRVPFSAPNLKSCKEHPEIVHCKLLDELDAGRIQGPFPVPPLDNFRVSPIGIVPKKSPGQFRLIHHLSHHPGQSINNFIEPDLSSVSYCSFDDAVTLLLSIGPGTLFSKTDIDSAFRLIPIHHSDHHLLGIQFQNSYYYDTCLPMGASSSCAIFERFSSALQFISVSHLNIPHNISEFKTMAPHMDLLPTPIPEHHFTI
ncbi:uncharacterized protein LOC127867602 [Dreissena polymorpha]|uniref:uncharacterized protein LOC127867602 n=1 Tax=Dreissena polymorpha TaxID=45954 RepID=UPI002263F20F|nr:uncharacterized protein LOC127867602 [Dreissena polymorpha]